jgi:hypothetical protein
MSTVQFALGTTRERPVARHPLHAPGDTRGFAGHLRGRVLRCECGHCPWRIEVVNAVKDRTVVSDDGFHDFAHAFATVEFATAAVREAWMRGYGQKSLYREGQKRP